MIDMVAFYRSVEETVEREVGATTEVFSVGLALRSWMPIPEYRAYFSGLGGCSAEGPTPERAVDELRVVMRRRRTGDGPGRFVASPDLTAVRVSEESR